MSDYAIETVNLTKTYHIREMRIRAVDNINLGFTRGEFTTIMGPSGSGKTTLLNLITSLERLTSGKILFKRQDITYASEEKRARSLQK